MSTALYPGVFDPVTYGHLQVVTTVAKEYSKVIVAVGNNENKHDYMLTQDERVREFQNQITCPNVEVKKMDCLLVDFANKLGVDVIVRGVRNGRELELQNLFKEKYCQEYGGQQPFEFVFATGKYKYISSTLVKEYMLQGKDYSKLTPWKKYDDVRRVR